MARIRITTKRQATFPKSLCEQMGLKPGDSVEVNAQVVEGERVWVLKPPTAPALPERPWFGMAGRGVEGLDHSMEAVRESIARGWSEEGREACQ